MKKLIAILTIAIVLVGAVFATDAASIRVTTSINAVEPIYQLKTAQITEDLAVAANQAAIDAITAAALAGNDSHVITTDALLTANQSVTFSVYQTNISNSVKTYTLSAVATDLLLYKYKNAQGEDVLVSATPHPETAEHPENTTFAVAAANAVMNKGNLADAKATYEGNGTTALSITYKGNAQPADVVVATFTCTWGANADAVTGDYQGTVTLTISST